jgi:putative sporulation protein YtxC
MKLFTVTLMEVSEELAENMALQLTQAVDRLHMDNNLVRIEHDRVDDRQFYIHGIGVMPEFQLDERIDPLYRAAAGCIADYILKQKEMKLIKSMIGGEFGYSDPADAGPILGYCERLLNGEMEQYECGDIPLRRKVKLIDSLHVYLQENTELNVQGFVRFRMQEYMEELRETVEYAIDEYLMDKQYQEFISLLKYFVYIQEAKIPVAHLIHKGGNEFTLFNEQLEPIDPNQFDSAMTVEMLDKEVNYEDMIVSTLITVSPRNIYIHTREPDVQVISTIMQIFENRVEVCNYCTLCQSVLGDSTGQNPKLQLGEQS